MELACEICGKEVLESEKIIRVEAGHKSGGLRRLFGYFEGLRGMAVAHTNCLELPISDLKKGVDVSRTEYVRNALFKLADVKLEEVDTK